MDKDKIIALWEQHLGAELFAKDVDATMATMTCDPYVNHVPTMTGGVGARNDGQLGFCLWVMQQINY